MGWISSEPLPTRGVLQSSQPRWRQALEQLIEMGVRAEQQALAMWGLNYVLDEYLPRKLENRDAFLP